MNRVMSKVYYNEQEYDEELKTYVMRRRYEGNDWKFTGKIKYFNRSVDKNSTTMELQISLLDRKTGFGIWLQNLFAKETVDLMWVPEVYFREETETPVDKIGITEYECTQ